MKPSHSRSVENCTLVFGPAALPIVVLDAEQDRAAARRA